ncbi:LLM class flavin-dependent oxidoreductase [Sphingobium sp. MK2]|jgi:alkanesulfonate monooxygenase SsuD/methylene tetrahydromethanopterin reductase-like flavin-dependent oxidoreductase (luciferase family)|uniref:LLM class flavin-dependent oxidoreductase n=1 Tax=Sphingobium sp. MK2 TaxID=3116540 RepID=UPI0032E36854
MIKPWLFEFFPAHVVTGNRELDFDPEATQQRFQDYIRLWKFDEELGFEGIFFSEHHFGPAYAPSPNLLIAYLASVTSTIRLGVNGTVSPYSTPWRVVEEYAMLDHLTKGRLEMGLVSGIPPECIAVGITPQDTVERHAEIMSVVEKSRTGRSVTHQGKHWSFEKLNLQPRMYQQNPSMWTAAVSLSSAERAGRNGWKLCVGFHDVAVLKRMLDGFRMAANEVGRATTPDDLAIRRSVYFIEPGVDPVQARAETRDYFLRALLDQADPSKAPPVSDDEFIVGTPEQVAEQIIAQCREVGCGNFLFGPIGRTFEAMWQCHETFGQKVIPILRNADIKIRE